MTRIAYTHLLSTLSLIMTFLSTSLMNKLDEPLQILTYIKNNIILPQIALNISTYYNRSQMHSNYKEDEKVLKNFIGPNISAPPRPTKPRKKIKLIIYYTKFNKTNLIIRNDSSPPTSVLEKTNIVYQFNCSMGDFISDKKVSWFDDRNIIKTSYTSFVGYKFDCTTSKNIPVHLHNTGKYFQTTSIYYTKKIIRKNLKFSRPSISKSNNSQENLLRVQQQRVEVRITNI